MKNPNTTQRMVGKLAWKPKGRGCVFSVGFFKGSSGVEVTEGGLFTQQEGGLGIKEWTCQSIDPGHLRVVNPTSLSCNHPLPPHKSNNFLQGALPPVLPRSFPWPPLLTQAP